MKAIYNKRFVLTISYGDYAKGVGGTDRLILAQQRVFYKAGISTIHLYPIRQTGYIKLKKRFVWGLTIDGYLINYYSTEEIISELSFYSNQFDFMGIIIHHLMEIDLQELSKILKKTIAPVWFYIHDYQTICPFGGLAFNNTCFCGASFPSSSKCAGCKGNHEENYARSAEIREFLNCYKDRLTFICPSNAAIDVWTQAYIEFKGQVIVIYHQKLSGEYKDNLDIIAAEEPLSIAFVGYQSPIKGWDDWIDSVTEIHNENKYNYEFYQFGRCKEHRDYITEVNVDFKDNLNAMIDALRCHKIQCAVLWSGWPETYSFTYYEAYCANCFILTTDKSGNIKDQVMNRGNGIVAEIESRLYDIISNEQTLRDSINSFRAQRKYGPESLNENDEIVEIVGKEEVYKFGGADINVLHHIYSKWAYINQKTHNVLKRLKPQGGKV